MKAVILAGGFGTRISEESATKPKPMIEIGGRPILWHIMKIYAAHGIRDFVICLGYKGYAIKEYFTQYMLHNADVTVDLRTGQHIVHANNAEDWRVTMVDTGPETMTGGRLKRVAHHLGQDDFCFTYGDAVADINIPALLHHHRTSGKLATVTAVQPQGRFGRLVIEGDNAVTNFEEKPVGDGGWINGGFFVLSPKVIDYIAGDATTWEREPLTHLATTGELSAHHKGFWQCMDTLRDKQHLESLWAGGTPPWKIWNDQPTKESADDKIVVLGR